MKTKYYFHIHHEVLVEALTEPLENRIKYIKENKPEDEIELRLRLIKPVKGKLPSEFIKAAQACDKAAQARDKAAQAWVKAAQAWVKAAQARDKAYQAWVKADRAWVRADRAWDKANQDNMPAFEKLHKKECGCGYSFIRKTIFTKENGLSK